MFLILLQLYIYKYFISYWQHYHKRDNDKCQICSNHVT